jgi:hypothetical protein
MPNVTESSTVNTKDDSAVGINNTVQRKEQTDRWIIEQMYYNIVTWYAKYKITCYGSAHFCLSIPRLIYLLLL